MDFRSGLEFEVLLCRLSAISFHTLISFVEVISAPNQVHVNVQTDDTFPCDLPFYLGLVLF